MSKNQKRGKNNQWFSDTATDRHRKNIFDERSKCLDKINYFSREFLCIFCVLIILASMVLKSCSDEAFYIQDIIPHTFFIPNLFLVESVKGNTIFVP